MAEARIWIRLAHAPFDQVIRKRPPGGLQGESVESQPIEKPDLFERISETPLFSDRREL